VKSGGLDRFASLMSRYVPDAITACAVLMLVLFAVALALGNSLPEVGEVTTPADVPSRCR
jgi:short subunit fatty acids transporter